MTTTWICGLAPRAAVEVEDQTEVDAVVAAARDGDREAFAELYRRYYSAVACWLRKRVRQEDLVEDLAQDVFLRMVSTIDNYQPREGGKFVAWLTGGVAHIVLVDHKRAFWAQRRAVEGEIDAVRRGADDAETSSDHAAAAEVIAALNRLTPSRRRYVHMRYVEGLPVSTTAEMTGCKPKTVEELCRLALKQLRRDLAPLAPAPAPAGSVFYTVNEVAALTGRSIPAIYYAIRERHLAACWSNGRWQVSAEALDAYVASAQLPSSHPRQLAGVGA
jgi:RNA polymerase sigma-70 factor, ECF subfamily